MMSPRMIPFLLFAFLLMMQTNVVGQQEALSQTSDRQEPMNESIRPGSTSGEAARSWLYGEDSGANDFSSTLLRIDGSGGTAVIGEIGISDITDIAILPDGRLFGISFSQLFRINIQKGTRILVGNLGVSDANALAANKSGQLFAATVSGKFGKVDRGSGRFRLIGNFGGGLGSSGDLAFSSGGRLYGTARTMFSSTDYLIRINKKTGQATIVGNIGFPEVFGLAFAPKGKLLGSARGDRWSTPSLISIKTSSGVGKQIKQISGANGMFGLAGNTKFSPVVGPFRVTGTENPECINDSKGRWTFCQHRTGFHRSGGGIQRSDDTYAWDANLINNEDRNQPVYAVAAGKVVRYAGVVPPGGSSGAVLIEHSQGGVTWWSGYLHMRRIAVVVDQPVDKGTILGFIGKAGATNDHLHVVFYEGSNAPAKLISFDAGFFKRSN